MNSRTEVAAPLQVNVPRERPRLTFGRFVSYVIILFVTALYLYPLVYLLNIALMTPESYLANPLSFFTHITFSNFVNAWVVGDFGQYVFNSFLYAIVPTFVSIVLTLFTAFPLARGYVKRPNWWYSFFLMSLFLPGGLIPQFQLMLHLHLYNSQFGYMLLNVGGTGLGFLILTGYIRSIPKELDESAAMDGCGYFRYVLTIIIPLVKPALATITIFYVIAHWNEIITPTIYLADKSKWPIVLGLFQFYGQYSNQWTVLAAGVITVAAPIIIMYVFLQKYFVAGAVVGSVKN